MGSKVKTLLKTAQLRSSQRRRIIPDEDSDLIQEGDSQDDTILLPLPLPLPPLSSNVLVPTGNGRPQFSRESERSAHNLNSATMIQQSLVNSGGISNNPRRPTTILFPYK